MICDFCSSPDPTWDYPATSFELFGLPLRSEGNWLVCETCHDLIESDRRAELLALTIGSFIASNPEFAGRESSSRLIGEFQEIQDKFFSNRTGAARRFERNRV